jgi:hypothetical protein
MSGTIYEYTDLTYAPNFQETVARIISHLENVIYSTDMMKLYSGLSSDSAVGSCYDSDYESVPDSNTDSASVTSSDVDTLSESIPQHITNVGEYERFKQAREEELNKFYMENCNLERLLNFAPHLDKSLDYWFRLKSEYITGDNIESLSSYIYDPDWSHYNFPIWNNTYQFCWCRLKKIRMYL